MVHCKSRRPRPVSKLTGPGARGARACVLGFEARPLGIVRRFLEQRLPGQARQPRGQSSNIRGPRSP